MGGLRLVRGRPLLAVMVLLVGVGVEALRLLLIRWIAGLFFFGEFEDQSAPLVNVMESLIRFFGRFLEQEEAYDLAGYFVFNWPFVVVTTLVHLAVLSAACVAAREIQTGHRPRFLSSVLYWRQRWRRIVLLSLLLVVAGTALGAGWSLWNTAYGMGWSFQPAYLLLRLSGYVVWPLLPAASVLMLMGWSPLHAVRNRRRGPAARFTGGLVLYDLASYLSGWVLTSRFMPRPTLEAIDSGEFWGTSSWVIVGVNSLLFALFTIVLAGFLASFVRKPPERGEPDPGVALPPLQPLPASEHAPLTANS
jgi:hypothetical protein